MPLSEKEWVPLLREAPWRSVEDLRTFVSQVSPATPQTVERMIQVLLEPKLIKQGPHHRNRCSALKAVAQTTLSPALFRPMAKALPQADPVLRQALGALMLRVSDSQSHDLLADALASDDSDLRRIAGEILKQVGGPVALQAVTKMAAKKTFPGRRDAMDSLVPRARHRAIPLLAAVIRGGNISEQLQAVRYLGDRELMGGGMEAAAHVLRPLLGSRDRRITSEAFKAYARVVSEVAFFDEVEAHLSEEDVDPAIIEAIGAFRSRRAVRVLEQRIRRGNNTIRLSALRALAQMESDLATPALVDALHQEDANIRQMAIGALEQLSQQGRVDLTRTLLLLLRSREPHVRRAAAKLSASAQDTTAGDLTHKLLQAVRDEDWWVRERVMDALVELDAEGLTEQLVELLTDPSPIIRRYAVYGLLRLRDPASLGAILRAAVDDEDWWVREQAVLACGALGDERAIPYLKKLSLERSDLRLSALEALETLGAEDELLELADFTADSNANVRHAVLGYLGRLPSGVKAAFNVQSCVNDQDARVAELANELLDRWKVSRESDSHSAATALLDRLLVAAARHEADDLLLMAERPPQVKRLGNVTPMSRSPLSALELKNMLWPIMNERQRTLVREGKDADFSYEVRGHQLRFRVNVLQQYTGLGAVFRRIANQAPALENLGLPAIVKSFADFSHGLVLVGGPTGSGKSTTLSALIGHINETHAWHVVTIEDPIEVRHARNNALINQREVGTHAPTFHHALRATLRQDPDVILVGELRDLDTIRFAVNAAETGHLVFATVHTTSAATTVDRLVHAFPAGQQNLIRSMLAESLRAVVCQQLVKRTDLPDERILVCEVLLNNDAVSSLIRKDKCFQIPSVMLTHRDQGMLMMDEQLERLVQQGVISAEDALLKSVDKTSFSARLVDTGEMGRAHAASSLPPGQSVGRGNSSWPAAGSSRPSQFPRGQGAMSFAPPRKTPPPHGGPPRTPPPNLYIPPLKGLDPTSPSPPHDDGENSDQ